MFGRRLLLSVFLVALVLIGSIGDRSPQADAQGCPSISPYVVGWTDERDDIHIRVTVDAKSRTLRPTEMLIDATKATTSSGRSTPTVLAASPSPNQAT
jgi:hypothetical protein